MLYRQGLHHKLAYHFHRRLPTTLSSTFLVMHTLSELGHQRTKLPVCFYFEGL
eukprot:CCRYP_012134-RA/>CCRYP_012134-RA protein AED:0.45 eAED:0.45 QI:54/1/1/1/0/0/3/121/52